MTRLLDRFATLTTVQLHQRGGYDGQGLPSYGTAIPLSVRAREASEYVQLLDGSQVRLTLDLWCPSGIATVPAERDRIVFGGENYIVEQVTDVRDIKNRRDHVRVRCRDE